MGEIALELHCRGMLADGYDRPTVLNLIICFQKKWPIGKRIINYWLRFGFPSLVILPFGDLRRPCFDFSHYARFSLGLDDRRGQTCKGLGLFSAT